MTSAGTTTTSAAARSDQAPRTVRTLVIWNPNAGGTGDVDDTRTAIRAALDAHGVPAELFESASEDDASRRVDQALADGVERIVAAGGDGTVRSIAFRLLGRETALGILPMGTAMYVARSLGIPLELEKAAAILASGSVRRVDVGYVGEQPFLEVATIGLAADAGEAAAMAQAATAAEIVKRNFTTRLLEL